LAHRQQRGRPGMAAQRGRQSKNRYVRGRGGVRRNCFGLHQRRKLHRGAACGRCGELARQNSHSSWKSAGHLEGDMPPTLTVCNTDSLGEQVQREFPDVRVVKALNTVNCEIMIAPSRVPGDHELFICGNDAAAKREVTERLCEWFGWKAGNIIDLG